MIYSVSNRDVLIEISKLLLIQNLKQMTKN